MCVLRDGSCMLHSGMYTMVAPDVLHRRWQHSSTVEQCAPIKEVSHTDSDRSTFMPLWNADGAEVC